MGRPDAYPEVYHKEQGLSLRPPLAWELELVEGCLRAVPEFVARHHQDDPAGEAMTVQVSFRPVEAGAFVLGEKGE